MTRFSNNRRRFVIINLKLRYCLRRYLCPCYICSDLSEMMIGLVTVRNPVETVVVVAAMIVVVEIFAILAEMVRPLKLLNGTYRSWFLSTRIFMFLSRVSLTGTCCFHCLHLCV